MASMVTMTQKNCKWSDISSTIFRKFNQYDVLILYGFHMAFIFRNQLLLKNLDVPA